MSDKQNNVTVDKRVIWPLQSVNFFMADLQAGVGPFLGIFLLAHGWKSGMIGSVMTIGGVAGMIMTIPAGALIDATKRKRFYVVISAIFTIIASCIILITQDFWLVSISQVATAIAGSAIGPAIIGITLGIVKQKGFNRQNGYNQAYNHAGNVVGAALSGYLGYKFGMTAIFILSGLFGVLAIICTLLIPGKAIDDRAARGMKDDGDDAKANGLKVLLQCKPLLILAGALAFFHLGNGAMLPLYGIAAAANHQGNASVFVAMTIVIAQVVMIATSLLAMRMAESKGYWLVLLISFLSLPVRGFIAAHMISHTGLYPVQILDGIGAGLQSVAVPGLVAHILNGTGRVNIGQGAVMTVQGLGAALSPAIGGWIAQSIGYSTTFMVLGAFAIGSVLLWLVFSKMLKEAC
ncbi:MFS transporter [Mucilaginibacter paludis]|uniref:Major facilitator superfamily MFS_1 n=1 Tax=Mucilaginibacter paludis DSM 18603 TaxID=714943 RepID=H1YIY6_9SPHI|nr:MFS transporter [Mucilaginibacter paludis]EHQ27681.1 major facilitator superfamily MFS_1 [Mucilaginibacter paludis DSM 18603]